jgi:sortase A
MARKVRPEDLNENQLRRLLIEKKRTSRKKRLDAFRRSGRLIDLAPIPDTMPRKRVDGLDITEPDVSSKDDQRMTHRKRIIDRALLFAEILAIAGLIFVLFNGVSLIQDLNQEVSAALNLPTFTPTPLLDMVVLPSGHTTINGVAQFNTGEIPEHLRPAVENYYNNLVIPTPAPEQAIRIQIPVINIDAQIVMGDGWEQLKQGVGQHVGSSNPGEAGNLVLSAHNDVFGQIFRHLDQLQVGDEIIIHTNIRSYTYVIDRETQIVEPTSVHVMDATKDPTVTLISCYPYLVNDKRIVVKAGLTDG